MASKLHLSEHVRGLSVQGMPHKVYHGRTGVVWNVTKRAVGVEVNKQVHTQASLPGVQQQAIPTRGKPESSLVHPRMSLHTEMTDLTLPLQTVHSCSAREEPPFHLQLCMQLSVLSEAWVWRRLATGF